MPRYSGWSFGITSPRRHAAMTGHLQQLGEAHEVVRACGPAAPRPPRGSRSLGGRQEVKHRADVVDRGPSGCVRTIGARVPSGRGRWRTSSGSARSAGPGDPRPSPDGLARASPRPSPGRRPRPPTWPADRSSRPGRPPGTPRARGRSRSTWPTSDEHRRRVRGRRVDADGQVRGADGARAEAGGRTPGELAVGLGRERRRALVAGRDHPDAGRMRAHRGRAGSSRPAR